MRKQEWESLPFFFQYRSIDDPGEEKNIFDIDEGRGSGAFVILVGEKIGQTNYETEGKKKKKKSKCPIHCSWTVAPRFSRGIFLLFSYENSSGGGDMQINGEERTVWWNGGRDGNLESRLCNLV